MNCFAVARGSDVVEARIRKEYSRRRGASTRLSTNLFAFILRQRHAMPCILVFMPRYEGNVFAMLLEMHFLSISHPAGYIP